MRELTRRDRAALALALECVRPLVAGEDWMRDESCSWRVDDAAKALRCASGIGVIAGLLSYVRHASRRVPPRLLRARLAIAIRVMLRVDAGDYGPRLGRVVKPGTCITCGDAGPLTYSTPHGSACCSTCAALARQLSRLGALPRRTAPLCPLWEAAPQHDPSITPVVRRLMAKSRRARGMREAG